MVVRSRVLSEHQDYMGRCKRCSKPMDVVDSGSISTPTKYRCAVCGYEVTTPSVEQLLAKSASTAGKIGKFITGLFK